MARRRRAPRRRVEIRHATSQSGYSNYPRVVSCIVVIGAVIVIVALFVHLQMGQGRLERMAEKNQEKTIEAILEVTRLELDRRENLSDARFERLEKRLDATNERLLQLASSKQNQDHVQTYRGNFGETIGAAIGGAIGNTRTLVRLAKTVLRFIF